MENEEGGEKDRATLFFFERSYIYSKVSECAYHSVGESASRDLGC